MSTATFGRYRIESLLGRGQMGEVHRAVDSEHGDRAVALKVLAPGLSDEPGYPERFRREARIAARMTEPHIVPVLDYGEIDGRLFIAMQLVEGRELARVLAGSGPMPPARAVGIIGQVAAALDAAHADGLVHRDVKPSNILISVPGAGRADFAQLADFGIARPTDPGSRTALTRTGSVVGTLAYLAPERFVAQPATPASDVYSLACVLHELLTGQRPYPGRGPGAQVAGHLHGPPPRPGAVRSGLPSAFDGVVARGTAKDPAARFRTAGELAAAARDALGSAPAPTVTAGTPDARQAFVPVPVPPAAPGPPRRRRGHVLAVTAAVAVAAVIVVLAVVSLVALRPGPPPAAPPAVADATPSTQPIVERTLVGAAPGLAHPPVIARIGDAPVLVLEQPDLSFAVLDLATGRPLGHPIGDGAAGFGSATATRLNGRSVLVAGGFDNVIRLWDLATGNPLPTALAGHTAVVTALLVVDLPSGPRLVSASRDGTVRQWDLTSGAAVGTPLRAASTDIDALAFSSPTLLAHTLDERILSWSLDSGASSGPPVPCRGSRLDTFAPPFGHPDLVCRTDLGGYDIRNALTGALVDSGLDDGPFAATSTALIGIRPLVVVAVRREIRLFDRFGGGAAGGPLTGHEAGIDWMGSFTSGNSTFLVSSSEDRSIRIWDLTTRVRG